MNINAFKTAEQIYLDKTRFLPNEQALHELDMLVERLGFIPDLHSVLEHHDIRQALTLVMFIMQRDFSEAMQQFAQEAVKQNVLSVLVGLLGRAFCQHCQDLARKAPQTRVVTAIAISRPCQQRLADLLLNGSDGPGKIVFEVLPTLVGGCLIIDPAGRTTDLSLHHGVTPLVEHYMQQALQELIARS